jgi:hypothetical protein
MTTLIKTGRKRIKKLDTKITPSALALQRVILRKKDGSMVRCSTYSHFSAAFKSIKIVMAGGGVESVALDDLKAIFFVKDFGGNPEYKAHREFVVGSPRAGRAVRVTFDDGEILRGKVINLAEDRPGFFMFPADPKDNNHKVFVVRGTGVLVDLED